MQLTSLLVVPQKSSAAVQRKFASPPFELCDGGVPRSRILTALEAQVHCLLKSDGAQGGCVDTQRRWLHGRMPSQAVRDSLHGLCLRDFTGGSPHLTLAYIDFTGGLAYLALPYLTFIGGLPP